MADIKQRIIGIIDSLPDNVTFDDVMAELYFRMKIEEGIRELDKGSGIPNEEVERRMAQWLKK